MPIRIVLFILCGCLAAMPVQAASPYAPRYTITMHAEHPSRPEQRTTCDDPSCSFTLDLNGHAPIDVVSVAGPGGIELYFKQGGLILPVTMADQAQSTSAVSVPAGDFETSRTVKTGFTVYAPDTLDSTTYPPLYWGTGAPEQAGRGHQRALAVKIRVVIRRLEP